MPKTKKCLRCGSIFTSHNQNPKFCSRKCHHQSRTNPEKQFWKFVHKTDGCWFWLGSIIGGSGYGKLTISTKTVIAHRLSWMLHKSAIPKGKFVLHNCDNRKCVNPEHLFLGTAKSNQIDRTEKGVNYPSEKLRRGESHPKSKFTAKQVIQIRKEFKEGDSGKLARKYGVSGQSILDLVRRRFWRHI